MKRGQTRGVFGMSSRKASIRGEAYLHFEPLALLLPPGRDLSPSSLYLFRHGDAVGDRVLKQVQVGGELVREIDWDFVLYGVVALFPVFLSSVVGAGRGSGGRKKRRDRSTGGRGSRRRERLGRRGWCERRRLGRGLDLSRAGRGLGHDWVLLLVRRKAKGMEGAADSIWSADDQRR
jgi:hypothetical protein